MLSKRAQRLNGHCNINVLETEKSLPPTALRNDKAAREKFGEMRARRLRRHCCCHSQLRSGVAVAVQ